MGIEAPRIVPGLKRVIASAFSNRCDVTGQKMVAFDGDGKVNLKCGPCPSMGDKCIINQRPTEIPYTRVR